MHAQGVKQSVSSLLLSARKWPYLEIEAPEQLGNTTNQSSLTKNFSMLQIDEHGPQASPTVCFCWNLSHAYRQCLLNVHVTDKDFKKVF